MNLSLWTLWACWVRQCISKMPHWRPNLDLVLMRMPDIQQHHHLLTRIFMTVYLRPHCLWIPTVHLTIGNFQINSNRLLHQQHHLPDHQNPQHNIPHCNRNQSSHGVMFDMNQQSAHFQQQHPYQHDRLTYNDNNINSYNNNQGLKPSSQFPVPKSDSNNNNIIVIPQMQPPVIAPSYPMTSQPPNVTAINVNEKSRIKRYWNSHHIYLFDK